VKQALHLPNITLATKVTILRILGIPVFILLLVYYTVNLSNGVEKDYQRIVALACFLGVALTDALDGYLARSRKEVTRLGCILDPLADKLLLVSALILLTRPSVPALQPQFPIAFTLLVISRDVLLIAGAAVIQYMTGQVQVHPRWTGKVTTFLQMVAVTWALSHGPVRPFMVIVWLAAAFTFISGLQYLLTGIRQFEREH
jgi:CDP-diacylglycerol--glycerol-3-phosphate 3-phosphatidyltransferase